jgi:hypothetical protein
VFSFEKMVAWQKAIGWADGIFDVADHIFRRNCNSRLASNCGGHA